MMRLRLCTRSGNISTGIIILKAERVSEGIITVQSCCLWVINRSIGRVQVIGGGYSLGWRLKRWRWWMGRGGGWR